MEEIVEIFGKRLKIVTDEAESPFFCKKCAIEDICLSPICEDSKGKTNRHFEEVID